MSYEIDPQDAANAIAIIGMAGRFPGAPDIASFWRILVEGRDTITRFAPEEATNFVAGESDFIAARGILDGVGQFDADFFNVPPREAERMDPQHRLLLECCANAFDAAGYDPHAYAGEIGLFAGCALNTYLLANLAHDRSFLDEFTNGYQVGDFSYLTGNDKDFLTTRIAYKLNLRGPVMTVQGACATSLVAVCQAAQSLLNYQCDMALAGGVSITFPQQRGHVAQEGSLTSRDGYCRPFDANASGTIFGHGAGVVLLKRYEDAVRDGDAIAAVIRGYAITNDGAQKAGYMAPGVDGQLRAITGALAMANISADTISYVEAHGTGTPMGDPIEVSALTQAYRRSTDRQSFCILGAAKGNIGHLDAAAGVTGLIKTVLQMQHRTLPGLAHFASPNPELHLEGSPFRLIAQAEPWISPSPELPLRAGVSAFGVGGVNAHVVLEEAPAAEERRTRRDRQVLCLSARTPEALAEAKLALAQAFELDPTVNLADAAYTLATGRQTFATRFAFAAATISDAVEALRSNQAPTTTARSAERVVFQFPGQGSQFSGMGHELYRSEPIYRDTLELCLSVAEQEGIPELRGLILGDSEAEAPLAQTRIAQPALFAVELALASLWQSWGLQPAALVGHSVGEYVAAVLAGVFSVEDAMRLVCLRAHLMQSMEPGAMLSVALGEDRIDSYASDAINVAAYNSQRASVMAGPVAAIEELEAKLADEKIACKRLKASHAFHSHMMQPMLAAFEDEVARVSLNPPQRAYVSTVTGEWVTNEQATDPSFWADQIRRPVRYAHALRTLLTAGYDCFLECGPGEALTSLALHQRSSAAEMLAVPSLPSSSSNGRTRDVRDAVVTLWNAGISVDPHRYYAAETRRRVSLPAYPFQRKLYWVDPPAPQVRINELASAPPMSEGPSPAMSSINATPAIRDAQQPQLAPARFERLQQEAASLFTELSGVDIAPAEYDLTFLELGLDSLFLTQATLAVSRRFKVKITLRQVMEQLSTIAAIAKHLDEQMAPEIVAASPVPAAPAPTSAITVPTPEAAGSAIEQLFTSQVVALSAMFAQQVAALQAAVQSGGVSPSLPSNAVGTPAPIAPLKTSAPATQASTALDTKHGSFRPPQRASQEITPQQRNYIDSLIARYTAKTPGSKRRTAADRLRLADPRAVSGFRPQWKEMVYPLVTDRALGSRLWDIDGNEYIDIVNGYGCIMFGHSPEFVVEAAKKQLDRGVAIGPQSALAGEVAKLICDLTGNERVTFCNTGSEAVMAAIRVARTVTGRDRVVYFSGDYHGTFDEVLIRKTPRGSAPIAPGIPFDNVKNITVLDYGTPEALEYIRNNADDIAAVLIEPVQTRHPENKPFDFIREVRRVTEQHGAAMILDEVVTGFRVAPGGVQEYLGIRADMCTYGKVIGGGHPIGVLSGKAQYLDALDGGSWNYGDDSIPEVGVTFFAGTFVRHPLAMAAAKSVLQHLKQKGPSLQETLNAKTKAISESLGAFLMERGVPLHIDHFASWFYFTFPGETPLGTLFYYAMRARGIHIQEGYPCFLTSAHTDADLAAVELAFRETILEMQSHGVLPSKESSSLSAADQGDSATEFSPSHVALTEPQREIFLAAALGQEANCAFNESVMVRLHGPLREADLRFAIDAVIARHDALRSVVSQDGESLCIAPAYEGPVDWSDLTALGRDAQEQALRAYSEEDSRSPFDLHSGPLLRIMAFRLSAQSVALVLTGHHIVLDGWSANLLLEEIAAVYTNGSGGLRALAPLLSFSRYAAAQREREARGEFEANERYWVNKFEGRSPRLDLPTDRVRPLVKTYSGATYNGHIDADRYARLKKFSARNGCSLYVTLLAGFELLLHRLSGQQELVVGISTAAQALLEGESLVGHCVNYLPLLSELEPAESVLSHMKAARTVLLDAQEHQEFTYGSLLRRLKLEREPGRLPLIEVQFNLERVGDAANFDGLTAEINSQPKQFVNSDLFLNVIEQSDGLHFACDYNNTLFLESTIERWMGHWEQLLESMMQQPDATAAELAILTESEQSYLRNTWNQTAVDFGRFTDLPSIVTRHAALTATKVALECNGRKWTYVELDEYATLLAHRLVHEGLKPGELVGICIERSVEMAGALLAVMKAGGAYVPLDPKHPQDRLRGIVDDAGLKLLLTGRDPSIISNAKMLNITGPQPRVSDPLPAAIKSSDVAYVIYTSGSTGKPKGVAIPHGALMNLLHSMQREPGLSSDDVLIGVTTLAFDIAALEMFLPMLTGAKLVIATDEQVSNGGLLLDLAKRSDATVLQATPGLWRILIDAGWDTATPLKALCGGEALPRDLANQLIARSASVWNVYGPTETTIWSSATRVAAGDGPLRLGTPIANTQFHVLDDQLRLCPIGVTGELCIGGDGLAVGYWHREELTAERFVIAPSVNARIYRTGDLARRHADGAIELLGRTDFQVKIRGYRIELGEIEAVLATDDAVREAIVLARTEPGTDSTRLVAFLDAGQQHVDPQLSERVRRTAERELPSYMVPPTVLVLPEFPRLPNTKVDRKALLRMVDGTAGQAPKRDFVPPSTAEQTQLAAIWADVLKLKAVSVEESIFEMGADSLAIFRIAARAQREGLLVKASQIFEHRTVAAVCHALPKAELEAKPRGPARISAVPRERFKVTR
ncbi:amino acid adenylation domain-containing protein [Bryocella elongata]|uniref:Amino acid adenylation domain-containing protein n=1 Tax=Bryocella elongata TaxID=863522 RepID=A0A1H6AX22_9BACT|nr:hybrid non-ribosomal peptide synthetase/type I polyketide synthase [Bryocella elongata]SEG52627.1 amino acid adenylation domain-containing protein [Bryocella elongata]